MYAMHVYRKNNPLMVLFVHRVTAFYEYFYISQQPFTSSDVYYFIAKEQLTDNNIVLNMNIPKHVQYSKLRLK